MKIEKISDNQICCTITTNDLKSSRLHLGDLTGNTEKVREFFSRLMLRARADCGFDFESGPLIIEAIHQPPDSLKLFITKTNDEGEFDEDSVHGMGGHLPHGAADIAGIIGRSLKRAKLAEETAAETESDACVPSAFRFSSLENAIRAAKVLKGTDIRTSLFRDTTPGFYLLIADRNDADEKEYAVMANILSEYSQPTRISESSESYFIEHELTMIENNAIEVLSAF